MVPEQPAILAGRFVLTVGVRPLLLPHSPVRHEHEQLDREPRIQLRRKRIQRLLRRRPGAVRGRDIWCHRDEHPGAGTGPSALAAIRYVWDKPRSTRIQLRDHKPTTYPGPITVVLASPCGDVAHPSGAAGHVG